MRDAEHREQARLFAWVRREEEARPELKLLFAVPNGGARNAATGARLKDEGVRRGVPDMCLPVARQGYHGLFIELKADEKGRPTKEQKTWIVSLAEQGYLAVVCYGADAARAALRQYLQF